MTATKGKIKEWHLDPSLLTRIISNADPEMVASVLTNYIKKTDIITKNQLDPTFLAEINTSTQDISNLLWEYRKTTDPIARTDLDADLRTLLLDIEDLLTQGGVDRDVLISTINTQINQILENSTYFATMKSEISAEMTDDISHIGSQVSNISEQVRELQKTINGYEDEEDEHVEGYSEMLADILERLDAPIDKYDLSDDLADEIDSCTAQIIQLSHTVEDTESKLYESLHGETGQVLLIHNGNLVYGDDIILQTEVVNDGNELTDVKATLKSPILYPANDEAYIMSLTEWDNDMYSNSHEITVPEAQTEEPEENNENELEEPGNGNENEPEEEQPEEVYVPLSYADFMLTSANLKTERITLSISSEITGTNVGLTDPAYVYFGFYGTRIKLYMSIAESKNIHIAIDNKYIRDMFFDESQGCSHACFLCVEGLSEGPHTVKFTIEPDETFAIDAKVSLDNIHAGLLVKADIQEESFYGQAIYNTGDYYDIATANGSYGFTKSNNVHIVTTDDYTTGVINYEEYNRRLVYAPYTQRLFYVYDNQFIMLCQNLDNRIAALEARIAALGG